jgi:hypothetical protein
MAPCPKKSALQSLFEVADYIPSKVRGAAAATLGLPDWLTNFSWKTLFGVLAAAAGAYIILAFPGAGNFRFYFSIPLFALAVWWIFLAPKDKQCEEPDGGLWDNVKNIVGWPSAGEQPSGIVGTFNDLGHWIVGDTDSKRTSSGYFDKNGKWVVVDTTDLSPGQLQDLEEKARMGALARDARVSTFLQRNGPGAKKEIENDIKAQAERLKMLSGTPPTSTGPVDRQDGVGSTEVLNMDHGLMVLTGGDTASDARINRTYNTQIIGLQMQYNTLAEGGTVDQKYLANVRDYVVVYERNIKKDVNSYEYQSTINAQSTYTYGEYKKFLQEVDRKNPAMLGFGMVAQGAAMTTRPTLQNLLGIWNSQIGALKR